MCKFFLCYFSKGFEVFIKMHSSYIIKICNQTAKISNLQYTVPIFTKLQQIIQGILRIVPASKNFAMRPRKYKICKIFLCYFLKGFKVFIKMHGSYIIKTCNQTAKMTNLQYTVPIFMKLQQIIQCILRMVPASKKFATRPRK